MQNVSIFLNFELVQIWMGVDSIFACLTNQSGICNYRAVIIGKKFMKFLISSWHKYIGSVSTLIGVLV